MNIVINWSFTPYQLPSQSQYQYLSINININNIDINKYTILYMYIYMMLSIFLTTSHIDRLLSSCNWQILCNFTQKCILSTIINGSIRTHYSQVGWLQDPVNLWFLSKRKCCLLDKISFFSSKEEQKMEKNGKNGKKGNEIWCK